MEADPMMSVCIWNNADCRDEFGNHPGRAEWEHCFLYGGRQISEWWAIIGVCWHHHRGKGLDKGFNQYRALRRVSGAEMAQIQKRYPHVDWISLKNRLIKKYGAKGKDS